MISKFARFTTSVRAPHESDKIELHEKTMLPVAKIIPDGLVSHGIQCSEPEWMGYEYAIICLINELRYEVSVSFDFVEFKWYDLSYHPALGFLDRLFGKSEHDQMRQLSQTLHEVMVTSDQIGEVRWYREPLGNPNKEFWRSPEIGACG